MPLAGGFLAPSAEAVAAEKRYPLQIHFCEDCGLVQIIDPIDPEILFQDYSFSSSTIKPLVDHFAAYAAWLHDRFRPQRVVEFGCNDGVLLGPLEALGIEAIGVDVSANITELARERGRRALTGYFNPEVGQQIRETYGPADLVTGSNAFAHNDDPGLILDAAKAVLRPQGRLCLEFMYAGDLLELLQWDTLYHEHLTFYCLSSIRILLERYGFRVESAQRLPMHGGSLRIVASLDPAAEADATVADVLQYEERAGLARPETWSRFSEQCARKIEIAKNVYGDVASRRSVWGYGAAGKATMWVNACEMSYLGAVVDGSPLRAGKLMPGTHTPIVPPESFRSQPPDVMIVTAWNYADVIRQKESWFGGTWSTPLPDLRFF